MPVFQEGMQGYERTGECRRPVEGELYEDDRGNVFKCKRTEYRQYLVRPVTSYAAPPAIPEDVERAYASPAYDV